LRDLTAAREITHLISESRPDEDAWHAGGWRVVGTVVGFERWVVGLGALKDGDEGVGVGVSVLDAVEALLKMEMKERLWIVERRTLM
jgi:hypothetical protein